MWYKRAHFLFQPSEFEGLSIALLEAMSYGVVPIASIIESGVQQVVTHGDNGFLFPVGMPEQCAQDIAYGLTNWANLSENAWNAVRQHYSLEQMCYAHARLYQSIATSPLKNAPHYVDQGYQGWRGWIARRTIPIPVYRSLCGPVI
jgi:glycosyltransferase involved in cell wall biosynthesis